MAAQGDRAEVTMAAQGDRAEVTMAAQGDRAEVTMAAQGDSRAQVDVYWQHWRVGHVTSTSRTRKFAN